jgi:hypothetical protein
MPISPPLIFAADAITLYAFAFHAAYASAIIAIIDYYAISQNCFHIDAAD